MPLPEKYQDWFGYGTSPDSLQDTPPSLDELKEQLAGQVHWIKEKYGDRLEDIFPPSELGMHTVSQGLVRTIYHEGMHALAIRRAIPYSGNPSPHQSY